MSDDLVKVAVRVRPLIQSEIDKGCQRCLNVIPNEQQIQIQTTDKAFTFNYVFPAESSQEEFYNTAIKNMVLNIFEGYNVTILAYGQTGSGKTFSMGTNYIENDVNCGVIPRAVNDIFENIQKKEDWDFKVTVAFMELYKEQLYDLLSKKPRNQCIVDIREDVRGIKIVGLSEIPVANTQETLKCLADGSLNRATGATAMNVQSSRSHAIFTVSVHQQKKNDPNTAKFAKFHLVDLAGSERSKKTQTTGERFKEGVNINKGLLALGNVISQLGEGGNSSYIGYRDSKLTRLLQDSLGGNSVTLMIACVSPADYNLDETTSTLRYADRAKKIKNKPIINQDPRLAEINNLKKIIMELRSAMYTNGQSGTYCPPEHMELSDKNKSLQRKLRGLTETLNSNITEMVHMHERAELAEQFRETCKDALSGILEDCENLLKDLDENPNNIENHKTMLENICMRLIALQKDEKRFSDELVTHEMTVESANNVSSNSDIMSNSLEENSIQNETYDLDEKHEEHTLEQAERVDEIQCINKQLAIKEELVLNLKKNDSQIKIYQKELEEMEQEIKTLQSEKQELIQALHTTQALNASAKISETRRKRVQELEKKIAELSRKCLEQNKIIKNKEKSDVQIKNLANEISALKQTKVKLIRSMRSETDKFNKWKKSREQELMRLKNQDRKRLLQLTRLQAESNKQRTVFKRKMEEAQATHKRLKDALDLQKKAMQRREKAANAKEDISSWITQELEVLLSTADAECTLEKLKQDKSYFASQLAELQSDTDDGIANQAQVAELIEFIELRNTQIKGLEEYIKESDQENRTKTRWHVISTMADAKEALRILFNKTASIGKDHCLLKSKFSDLKEHDEKLKTQLERYELRESKSRQRKEYLGIPLSKETALDAGSTEKNRIEELLKQIDSYKEQVDGYKEQIGGYKEEIDGYKEQIENLQNNILTNKDTNIVEKKPKTKTSPKVVMLDETAVSELGWTDDSVVDDDENDPDWRKTPLYSRIQKIEHHSRIMARESKIGLKRSSNGDVKCSCKTQCSSRLCTCRKNEVSCENCNCNPLICKNRNVETRRELFTDSKERHEIEKDMENKKPKLEVN